MKINVKEIRKVPVSSLNQGDCFTIEGTDKIFMRVRKPLVYKDVDVLCVNVGEGTLVILPDDIKVSVVHAVMEVSPLTIEEAEEWRGTENI